MTTFREDQIRAWREALQPLVYRSMGQLTDQQWEQLRSGAVRKDISNLIKRMCTNIICVMTSLISEVYIEALQAALEGQDPDHLQDQGSPDSENQRSLCDAIVSAFVEVNSTEEVAKLVRAELEDRLSLRLKQVQGQDQSSQTKKPLVSKVFRERLKTIVKHVVRMIKTCACWEASSEEAVSSGSMASREEPVQTPVTPFEREEPPESPGGWVSTATDAVKVVLEEVAEDMSTVGSLDGFSAKERDQVQSSLSHEATSLAFDIVQAAIEERDLEPDSSTSGTSESESKPKAKTCCQRAARRIQAFYTQRFARCTIFSSVSELKKKCSCGKSRKSESFSTSVPALLDGVDWVMEDVIPVDSDQGPSEAPDQSDLYQTIADNISGETEEVISERLNKMIYHYIGPEPEDKLDVQSQVQASVDTSLQRLKKWLQRQAWLKKFRKDAASEALQRVEEVMQTLPQEGDTEDAVSEEAAAASCSHQLTGSETAVDDVPPADGVLSVDDVLSVDGVLSVDDVPPVDDVTEPVAETKTSPVWKQSNYKVLVMELVEDITKDLPADLLKRNVEISAALTEKLWVAMAGCDGSSKPNTRHMDRIIKAVKKELTKQLGKKQMVPMYLLTGTDEACQNIVDILKKHLMAPKKKKKSFFSFFSCFWKKK